MELRNGTYERVLAHFGGVPGLAQALGISRAAVYKWAGDIPPLRCYEIARLSDGEFSARELLGETDAPD